MTLKMEIAGQDSAAPKFKWKVETVNDLLALPNPKWIVDQIIPEGAFVLVYGPHGSGKSFLALDLCQHLGYRSPKWFDFEIDQPSRPIYVAAEGGGGVIKRVKAWFEGNQIEPPLDPISQFIRQPINLMDEGAVNDLIDMWVDRANPGTLFLDTWSRCMAGANENSAEHTSLAVQVLDQYRDDTGSAVFVVHHTPNEAKDRPRGSNALIAACDVAIMVENRNGTRVATVIRSRDGEEGFQFCYTLESVDLGLDDKDRPVRSCVVVPTVLPKSTALKTPARGRGPGGIQQIIIDVFDDALSTHGEPSPGFTGMPTHGRVVKVQHIENAAAPRLHDKEPKRRNAAIGRAITGLVARHILWRHEDYLWKAD